MLSYRCVHAWEEGIIRPSEVKSSEYDLASGTATSSDAASFILNTAAIMSNACGSIVEGAEVDVNSVCSGTRS